MLHLNALAAAITPRQRFWTQQGGWPDDFEDYEFLGRHVLQAGRSTYRHEWSDLDPAVKLIEPLPEDLSLDTPIWEIRRASYYLREHVPVYAERSIGGLLGPGFDFPTRDEWTIARRLVEDHAAPNRAAFRRFIGIEIQLLEAFRSGTLTAVTRGNHGGDFAEHPRHFWNMEQPYARFDTCRVHPFNHFDISPAEAGGNWLFVKRSTAQKAASSVAATAVSEQKISEVEARKPRLRAGRKPKTGWHMLMGELVKILHTEGIPEDANVSALARRLWDLANVQGVEDIPDPKTIEGSLRAWLTPLIDQ